MPPGTGNPDDGLGPKFREISNALDIKEGERALDGRTMTKVLDITLQRLRKRGKLTFDSKMGWRIPPKAERVKK